MLISLMLVWERRLKLNFSSAGARTWVRKALTPDQGFLCDRRTSSGKIPKTEVSYRGYREADVWP